MIALVAALALAMAQRLYDEQTGKTNVLPAFKDALGILVPMGNTPRAALLLRPTGGFAEDYAIFETPKKFPGKANDFQKLDDNQIPPVLGWEETSQRLHSKRPPPEGGGFDVRLKSTEDRAGPCSASQRP